jgi:hypothetical protein
MSMTRLPRRNTHYNSTAHSIPDRSVVAATTPHHDRVMARTPGVPMVRAPTNGTNTELIGGATRIEKHVTLTEWPQMLERYRTTAQRGVPVPKQKPILPDGRGMAMPMRRLWTVRRSAKTAVLRWCSPWWGR